MVETMLLIILKQCYVDINFYQNVFFLRKNRILYNNFTILSIPITANQINYPKQIYTSPYYK